MTLEDSKPKRDVKTVARKTQKGKELKEVADKERRKNQAIVKASIAKKEQDGDSDWESVEEDAPAVQLTELLDNMKIEDDSGDEGSEEEK